MKKLYFKLKFYWHVLQFKQLKIINNNHLNDSIKLSLDKKIYYHEKCALNYIMKS